MLPLRDENPTLRRALVTLALIIVNVGVFVGLQRPAQGDDRVLDPTLRFNLEHAAIPCELRHNRPLTFPEAVDTFSRGDVSACRSEPVGPALYPDKQVWLAALSSMFLHGGWLHLGGNMLFLWIFGNNIEDHMGRVRHLVFYLAAGLVATLAHVAVDPGSTVPLVGASGAVAGVMGAYLVWFPRAPITTVVWLVVPFFVRVPAALLLALWFGMQFFTAPTAGVAWVAHVGGFVFGMVVAGWVRASPSARRWLWRAPYRHATFSAR